MYRSPLFLLLVLGVFAAGGCAPAESGDNLEVTDGGLFEISIAAFIYSVRNQGLPDTKEQLICFCSKPENVCPPVDWDRFSFRKVMNIL